MSTGRNKIPLYFILRVKSKNKFLYFKQLKDPGNPFVRVLQRSVQKQAWYSQACHLWMYVFMKTQGENSN